MARRAPSLDAADLVSAARCRVTEVDVLVTALVARLEELGRGDERLSTLIYMLEERSGEAWKAIDQASRAMRND